MKSTLRSFKIHKYTLQIGGKNVVKMPAKAKILSAQIQREHLVMWASFFSDDKETSRLFFVRATGVSYTEDPAESLIYISTVSDGDYVWHVFESVRK